MKNLSLVLSFVSITLASHRSYAWRIGSMHGDDPPAVTIGPMNISPIGITATPKVSNQAQVDATNLGNLAKKGVGDTLRNLHVQEVLDHNSDTFADIGSIRACFATLCYSEEVRRRQLSEQRDEFDNRERRRKAMRASLESTSKSERIQSAQDAIKRSDRSIAIFQEGFDLEIKELKVLTTLSNVVLSERTFRAELSKNHMPLGGIEDHEITPVAREFSRDFRKNLTKASLEAQTQIESIATAKKVSTQRLKAELIRSLDGAVLDQFSQTIDVRQKQVRASIEKKTILLDDAKATLKANTSALKKEQES